MKETKYELFKESLERFNNYKNIKASNDIVGFCLWEIYHQNKFIIQGWASKLHGTIIVQIWPRNAGFTLYYPEFENSEA